MGLKKETARKKESLCGLELCMHRRAKRSAASRGSEVEQGYRSEDRGA